MDYKRPSEKPKPEFSDGLSVYQLQTTGIGIPLCRIQTAC